MRSDETGKSWLDCNDMSENRASNKEKKIHFLKLNFRRFFQHPVFSRDEISAGFELVILLHCGFAACPDQWCTQNHIDGFFF
jgi:hypothetical protein